MYNVNFFKSEFFSTTKKQQILIKDFEKRKQKADKATLVKAEHSCDPSTGMEAGGQGHLWSQLEASVNYETCFKVEKSVNDSTLKIILRKRI